MRVLIVGCGYVGIPLGAELVRLGHEVFGMRRDEAASEELKTAGTPSGIILSADKMLMTSSWDDVTYITATVVDEDGIPCPNADNLITFNVSEAGTIVAVDNGDPESHEAYQASERHAFRSQCIAILKAKRNPGMITITAVSPQLKPGLVIVEAR